MKNYHKMPQILAYLKKNNYQLNDEAWHAKSYANNISEICVETNRYCYILIYYPKKRNRNKRLILNSNTQKGIIDMLNILEGLNDN